MNLWAAFTSDGQPIMNLWRWNKRLLLSRMSDRSANGEAFAGEHTVNITIEGYNRLLADRGWPAAVKR